MASSSSSSHPSSSLSATTATGRWTYDVFLSFRGEDTRKTFVDHLYAALDQQGIRTFKDDKKLEWGEPISQEILKAIEESRCAIIIFSRSYASSSWCLDELVKIMQCQEQMGQWVLPVFYDVDPSDVRGQRRSYEEAFRRHQEKYSEEREKVNRWRDALTKAASLSGCHVANTANGHESESVKLVVVAISVHTEMTHPEKNLIGMESHVQKLKSLLCMGSTDDVHIIGIWGMGGIGKTTMAMAVFQEISYKFEGCSFVKDVREIGCDDNGLKSLQEKILKEILMTGNVYIRDCNFGVHEIRRRLCSKKILLVLDDVNNVKQLEYLAATHEWFGPGSRIILTTRDEHLLSAMVCKKYKPDLLRVDQAIELFSRYAFKENRPPKGYEELSSRTVSYVNGLPLALKVLGSYLCGKEVKVWESALRRLAQAQKIEIFESLKLSFDGLDDVDKKIFLDVACFFKGRDKEDVSKILDSFGFEPEIGLSVLIERSLLTVSKGRLVMHDLVQEMGQQIASQSFRYSRLWHPEEISDALIMSNTRLEAVEAICCHFTPMRVNAGVFRSMKKLRLLDIHSEFTLSEPACLPDGLQWLTWSFYPFESVSLKTETGRSKLVYLEMSCSSIEELQMGPQFHPNLKVMDLSSSRSLTRIPDISGASNLERLKLSYCESLTEVHQSVGFLKSLVYLNLSDCGMLKTFPSSIKMKSLETLILSCCSSIEKFPEISPDMGRLAELHLDGCRGIKDLPSSIRFLTGLRLLNLRGCSSLPSLPNTICELKLLKSLNFRDCPQLQILPEHVRSMEQLEEFQIGFFSSFRSFPTSNSDIHAFLSLHSLRKLDLSGDHIRVVDFPSNLHGLSSLEELNLSFNKFTQLPASILHLSHLKLLNLSHCYELEELKELPLAIQVLKATSCWSLKKIGDLSKDYEWLYKIWLFGCHKLLDDQDSKRHLANILQQSFIHKCAAVGHRLCIAVPASNIPDGFSQRQLGSKIGQESPSGWYKEQEFWRKCTSGAFQDQNFWTARQLMRDSIRLKPPTYCYHEYESWSDIALKLPSDWQKNIKGFALCCVFCCKTDITRLSINFKLAKDEKILEKQCLHLDHDLHVPDAMGNVWIGYVSFEFFRQLYHDFQPEDWSQIGGYLVITVSASDNFYMTQILNFGAHIVYNEDVESFPWIESHVADYGDWDRSYYFDINHRFHNRKAAKFYVSE